MIEKVEALLQFVDKHNLLVSLLILLVMIILLFYIWMGSLRNHQLMVAVVQYNQSLNLPIDLEVGWLKAKVKVRGYRPQGMCSCSGPDNSTATEQSH